jgi:hypothetical protein
MIDQILLETWMGILRKGGRISALPRAAQRDLVEEILQSRIRIGELERENQKLVIQNKALNESLGILSRRGERSGGLVSLESQLLPTHPAHGSTVTLELWMGEVLTEGMSCDWGGCDKPSTKARFDAHGVGWIPCCEQCAVKPL